MKDELVEVTQADRDEALVVMHKARGYAVSLGDGHFAVQAFARHRLSSSPVEEAPADVAETVGHCENVADVLVLQGNPKMAEIVRQAAALINRLSADLAERDRMLGEAFETLARIHQCADEELVRNAAKETADKIEARLSQQGDQSDGQP